MSKYGIMAMFAYLTRPLQKDIVMPLDEKRRLMLDKVFFAFGSQMHACEHNPLLKDEWVEFRQEAWVWAIKNVGELIDFVCREPDAPPHAQNTPVEQSLPLPPTEVPSDEFPESQSLTKTITVKEVKVLKASTGKHGEWSLFGVKGDDNIVYTTFAGSRFQPGATYTIQYEKVPSKDGKRLDHRIINMEE